MAGSCIIVVPTTSLSARPQLCFDTFSGLSVMSPLPVVGRVVSLCCSTAEILCLRLLPRAPKIEVLTALVWGVLVRVKWFMDEVVLVRPVLLGNADEPNADVPPAVRIPSLYER